MIRCDRCELNFSGKREYCPLCGKKLSDQSGPEDFGIFPIIPIKKEKRIFLQVATFISLAAMIIICIIDQLIPEIQISFLMCFGIACAYVILAVGYKKWKNSRKTVIYEGLIGIGICILWDWYLGWKGWSIDYVMPLAVVVLNAFYFILGLADREHQTDYGIYFLITITGTILVLVLLLAGVILNRKLALITTGIGIILLLAEIIFYGRPFFAELSRRLHV